MLLKAGVDMVGKVDITKRGERWDMGKITENIRELNELEEVVENEINRLWKEGATLEEAAEAGARLAKQYWKKKNADKSGG